MSSNPRSRDTRLRFEQWLKNPHCTANTVSAVKGYKMSSIAKKEGVTETREQSVFAVFRGNVFEKFILKDEGKLLVEDFREQGLLNDNPVVFHDFRTSQHGGRYRNHDDSLLAVKTFLDSLSPKSPDQNLMIGVTIRIPGGGMLPEAILVIDVMLLIKSGNGFVAHIGEIKSYPDKDGYTNPGNLSSARAQAGIYVHGFRVFLSNECKATIDISVNDKGFLVFSLPGSNFPSVRANEDLKYQAQRAQKGFKHLQDVANSIEPLSDNDTEATILTAKTEYTPQCFQFCDRAPVCLEKATKEENPIILGEEIAKFVGGLSLGRVIELINKKDPKDETEEEFLIRFTEFDGHGKTKRIRSYEKGMPLPRREKKTVKLLNKENLIYLSFVRMGGESLPWGISWGKEDKLPQTVVVPDPWVRDDLAESLKEFEKEFNKLIRSMDSFQIILPNSSHLEMMQNIALRYTYAKRGDDDHKETLNRLGRIFTFLFLESQRPGQQMIVVASELLKEHYTFPADDLRQGHLGFLMSLLTTKGTLQDKYNAGKVAELKTVGISLSPDLEKNILQDLIEKLRDAKKSSNDASYEKISNDIKKIIIQELIERDSLLKLSTDYFRSDKRQTNPGCDQLWDKSNDELKNYFAQEDSLTSGGKGYFKSPKTDKDPISAAVAYHEHIHSGEESVACLVPYDKEIQNELIGSGDAFLGKLVRVEEPPTPGAARATTRDVVWVLESDKDHSLRIKEKADILALENNLSGTILSIEIEGDKKIIKLKMHKKTGTKNPAFLKQVFTFSGKSAGLGLLIMRKKILRSQRKVS